MGRHEKTPWNPSRTAIGRVKNPLPAPESCPFCGGDVAVPHHRSVYGREYGEWPWVYQCRSCDARVGMHPYTDIPLGTLADAATRQARERAKRLFEPLHRASGLSRSQAYQALAEKMNMPVSVCHFGWFDLDQCKKAEAAALALRIGAHIRVDTQR